MPRREIGDLGGQQPDAMDQRQAQRVQQHLARRHARRIRPDLAQRQMIGVHAAEHRLRQRPRCPAVPVRAPRLTSASRLCAIRGVLGAIEPGPRIERRDHRAQHVDIGMRQRVRRQVHRAMEAPAVLRADRRTVPDAAPRRRRCLAACSRTSRAAGGSRCSGSRAVRAGGGCAPHPPCHRPAVPRGASRCDRPTLARMRRAARHSLRHRPVPPCRRARWRRSRRRSRDWRRPDPRSDRPPDDRSAARCAVMVASASSGVPNSR